MTDGSTPLPRSSSLEQLILGWRIEANQREQAQGSVARTLERCAKELENALADRLRSSEPPTVQVRPMNEADAPYADALARQLNELYESLRPLQRQNETLLDTFTRLRSSEGPQPQDCRTSGDDSGRK